MMDQRPDPDRLLKQVQAEEQAAHRGKLKLFFGACAGVGKTYAMLEAARQRKAEGLDVAIGLVETHGRTETAALLDGLEQLPRRLVEHQGAQLPAFDLDAALARRPQILLVDELAHTNEPGCRHTKRWQDVLELLDQGIDVYTTLNVQHLETMNDVVAQVTGVVVRETVPDSVFEQADEVELVDLAPVDLLKRLKEGKVYLPQQAQQALQHFFRESNLTALREIALRMTADRVNEQVQQHRRVQGVAATWATTERLLVCVGPSQSSLQVIRATHRMARRLGASWIGVYVETPAELRLSADVRSRVSHHLRVAEQLGAETVTLSGQRVVEEILTYARTRNVTTIVVGQPARDRWRDRLVGSPVDQLIRQSGDIQVHVIRGVGPAVVEPPSAHPRSAVRPGDYLFALGVVVAISLASGLLALFLAPVNVIMLYLLGVVVVAWRAGRWPSVMASVLSVLLFDFFFVPPRFTFAVSDSQYVLTFLVMLVVALVISELTARFKQQAEASRLREQRTAALYALSRELVSNRGTEALLQIAVRYIAEVFESQLVALLPDAQGRLVVRAGWPSPFAIDDKEQAVAQWAYDLGQIAGKGTDTLPACGTLYVPMMASGAPVGALGVRPKDPARLLIPDQLHLLEAFAHQTGLAIENDRLSEAGHRAQAQIETERLRNTILSSIPHDLRTPLAAITGSATSLLEGGEALDAATRRDLAHNIYDEAERLSTIVNNVLDMTKIESGALALHRELLPIEEVVGGALNRLERRLAGRPIETRIPQTLPMVPMDGLLMEQVIINLLDNALKYTPVDSPIEITAAQESRQLLVDVADRGPGLPSDHPERLFEKFYRGGQQGREGFGLGLTICRGIVAAHGGTMQALNRPGGGALFRVALPLATVDGRPPVAAGMDMT